MVSDFFALRPRRSEYKKTERGTSEGEKPIVSSVHNTVSDVSAASLQLETSIPLCHYRLSSLGREACDAPLLHS